jgi:hypothetical protein
VGIGILLDGGHLIGFLLDGGHLIGFPLLICFYMKMNLTTKFNCYLNRERFNFVTDRSHELSANSLSNLPRCD